METENEVISFGTHNVSLNTGICGNPISNVLPKPGIFKI